jgi:hypothetical protein
MAYATYTGGFAHVVPTLQLYDIQGIINKSHPEHVTY